MTSKQPAKSYIGHVKNGAVVIEGQVALREGQTVRVERLEQRQEMSLDTERDERVRQLQQLFAAWTEEDAKFSEEEADCLQAGLEQNRGLGLRPPKLD